MNGAAQEDLSSGRVSGPRAEKDDDSATPPTEAEVQTIIQTIRDVSSGPTSPLRTDDKSSPLGQPDDLDDGAYWDLSSMAPLNAASAVSTCA